MPVTVDENERYRQFVHSVATELGVFDFAPDQVVWHYTNENGLLGILQSSTLHATQVAFLNDNRETKYATELFQATIREVIAESEGDAEAIGFFEEVLRYTEEDPKNPVQGISKFFITSFSGLQDDVQQWDRYSRPHGYAIGFHARGLNRESNSSIYRVVYDQERQKSAVKKIVAATLTFFREGLTADRQSDPEKWAREFYLAWDEWIYKLAPLAKHVNWQPEQEFRLVHELKLSEFPKVRFMQKGNTLARYLPLDTPSWMPSRQPVLPISRIVIGPGNEPTFTAISVRLLLEQMGYVNVPVETTTTDLVWR